MTWSIVRAAFVYFAVVFAAGFAMGAVRVFLVAQRLGELPAVSLEAPLMLAVSWVACGASIRLFGARGRVAGLGMGALAFALLMAAELALAVFGFGRSPADHLRAYGSPAGLVGLSSQIAFGLMPLLRSRSPRAPGQDGPARTSSMSRTY